MSNADVQQRARRERILDVVSDLVADFLYYDRKECESLPRGEIEAAVAAGEVTADEIVDCFRRHLVEELPSAPRVARVCEGCGS